MSDLEGRLERSGGRVEVGDLPTIQADATQIRQLLQNLIDNALKFHRPETPPTVHVAARTVTAESGALAPGVEITVSDNGIGLDPEQALRAFQPFVRLVGRSQYEGSGMGLAICRRIAERHGGRIWVENLPEHGARFVLWLPAQPGDPLDLP